MWLKRQTNKKVSEIKSRNEIFFACKMQCVCCHTRQRNVRDFWTTFLNNTKKTNLFLLHGNWNTCCLYWHLASFREISTGLNWRLNRKTVKKTFAKVKQKKLPLQWNIYGIYVAFTDNNKNKWTPTKGLRLLHLHKSRRKTAANRLLWTPQLNRLNYRREEKNVLLTAQKSHSRL